MRVFFLTTVLILVGGVLQAQPPDSLQTGQRTDSLSVPDSVAVQQDTLAADTVKKSDNPIKSEVSYEASDSMIYDLKNGELLLFGESSVQYEKIKLEAARISYTFNDYLVHAEGTVDTAGNPVGEPIFTDEGTTYNAESMDYNFRTKKGIVRTVQTQVPEGYLTGKKVKTTQDNEVIYVKDASFCPCEDPEAHTRFKISRLKMVKDKQIIAGPGYLSFYNIPTPIAFPFGFFPNVDKQQAGLIIPSYGDSREFGLFLQGLGFYMPLGNKWDTQITSDIYSSGSYFLENRTRYKKRYKYDGAVTLNYSLFKSGDEDIGTLEKNRRFFIRWNHSQAAKATPFSSFSADVNFGSSDNFRQDLSSSQQNFLQSTFSSGIQYSRSLPGTPFRFSMNATHSQNTQTQIFNVSAPNVNLAMQRIRPFSNLGGVGGGSDWYENIGLTYNMEFRNELQVPESALRMDNLDSLRRQFRNGVRHTASLVNSFNIGYFSLNPNIRATERWYFRTIERRFDEDTQTLVTDTIPGFERELEYSGGASLTTKLYGLYNFGNDGWLRAIRHTFTPNISFNMSPNFDPRVYGFYGSGGGPGSYSPYEGSVVGQPSSGSRANLGVSLVNSLEGKIFNPSDTASAINKINIIDNFTIRSNYNFLADSLNLSPVNLTARTRILNKLNVNFSSSFNPYDVNENGQRVDRLLIESGKLAEMTSMSIAVGGSITGGRDGGSGEGLPGDQPPPEDGIENDVPSASQDNQDFIESLRGAFVDFSVPWSLNFNYLMSQTTFNSQLPEGGFEENTRTDQSVQFSGDLRLFQKVIISVQSGYDFTQEEFSTTTINMNVDLNCWELRATIIPTGIRQSYSVGLNIKSTILRDLKLQRRGNLGSEANYF